MSPRSSKKPRVYAFIDSQNLNLGVSREIRNKSGKLLQVERRLDYRKFRRYLLSRYNVTRAFLFLGYMPENTLLYQTLKRCGFELIFKEVIVYTNADGKVTVKGNVDTDIVLHAAALQYRQYDIAIFASGDGDFLSLYDFLDSKGKLGTILIPSRYMYSRLLRKYLHKIVFVGDDAQLFR